MNKAEEFLKKQRIYMHSTVHNNEDEEILIIDLLKLYADEQSRERDREIKILKDVIKAAGDVGTLKRP